MSALGESMQLVRVFLGGHSLFAFAVKEEKKIEEKIRVRGKTQGKEEVRRKAEEMI